MNYRNGGIIEVCHEKNMEPTEENVMFWENRFWEFIVKCDSIPHNPSCYSQLAQPLQRGISNG